MKTNNNPSRQTARRLAPIVAAAVLLIALGGGVHGRMTQRWGEPADLVTATQALERFPESFGDWRLQDSEAMDPNVTETLQCAGYVNRSYLNVSTSEVVRIAIIVGPPGPTAVHTPEICYSSSSYTIDQKATSTAIAGTAGEDTFWAVRLRSKEPGGGDLYVYYAWTDGKVWKASEAPRYEYGGAPFLFKIQVAGQPLLVGKKSSDDLCERFLKDLMQSGWSPDGTIDSPVERLHLTTEQS